MFIRLITDVDTFLHPYHINLSSSDILENCLLNLADIKALPEKCSFSGNSKFTKFKLYGILEEEAQQFLTFLQTADEAASMDLIPKNLLSEDLNCNRKNYLFLIQTTKLHEVIIPKFKEKIIQVSIQEPEFLRPYQQQYAKNNHAIKTKLLQEISLQINELNNVNFEDDFTNGEMHVLIPILQNAIELNHTHPEYRSDATDIFETVLENFKNAISGNIFLQKHATVTDLLSNLTNYRDVIVNSAVWLLDVNLKESLPRVSSGMFSLFSSSESSDSEYPNSTPSLSARSSISISSSDSDQESLLPGVKSP